MGQLWSLQARIHVFYILASFYIIYILHRYLLSTYSLLLKKLNFYF